MNDQQEQRRLLMLSRDENNSGQNPIQAVTHAIKKHLVKET